VALQDAHPHRRSYPAGGNADSSARAVAEVVSAGLKQTIIVDNRPGASSVIGTEVVARAPADGYTLGVVSDSHAINQAIAKLPKASELLGAKVGYDAVKDFVPVSGLIRIPLVLVVQTSLHSPATPIPRLSPSSPRACAATSMPTQP
jgi:tripartite-type tricarboxylate transporter receptor subunit TctC